MPSFIPRHTRLCCLSAFLYGTALNLLCCTLRLVCLFARSVNDADIVSCLQSYCFDQSVDGRTAAGRSYTQVSGARTMCWWCFMVLCAAAGAQGPVVRPHDIRR